MKKRMKIILKSLLCAFVIILILFFTAAFFEMLFFPRACMYGENISRELAIKSIDRGDSILPKNIENISFFINARNYPRFTGLFFTGKVDFNDFNDWCKEKKINLSKDKNINIPSHIVKNLKLPITTVAVGYDVDAIGVGYYEGGAYDGIVYDETSKICYAYLFRIGPPRSISDFERVWIFFFPYFTNYWRDLEVKEK